MNSLVIFDSLYGNTRKIAEVIAKELGTQARAISVSEVTAEMIAQAAVLVVGSPINGWRPSEKMAAFLKSLSAHQLDGIKAAAFDTRMNVFFHGDASKKIAKKLKAAGAELISPPQQFFVTGMEGPLSEGELEKAKLWAKSLK